MREPCIILSILRNQFSLRSLSLFFFYVFPYFAGVVQPDWDFETTRRWLRPRGAVRYTGVIPILNYYARSWHARERGLRRNWATCTTPAFRHACNVEQECEQASTIMLARVHRIVAGRNFNPTAAQLRRVTSLRPGAPGCISDNIIT